jgi:DNA processing protein
MDHQTVTPEALIGTLNEVERKNAPRVLYIAGDVDLFSRGPRVSVVGTRHPSEDGFRRARRLTKALVEKKIIVVSGLADGIDTEAHVTAIEGGGRTIAVLGTGLDRSFPPENAPLLERIMKEHLAISQFQPGTPPKRTNFPQRNRTMALLSDATVIVEAGEGSGTLHQGWEALRLGRPLFLLESLAHRADLTWPAEMIRYGAQVLSRENLDLALEEIPERARDELAL